ncbi:MAG: diguanylate cyclase [Deltaproteobacteria bacterium]|nr:diguanylate cyclase [Deltaproteobacteria bacterium]
MPSNTKSKLTADNADLRVRLAELGTPLSNLQPVDKTLPGDEIADRIRIEHELAASEVRYRRLFETAKDGILLLDADTGMITDVNPFLMDLLGYSHDELLGKKLWEIGPFRDITASQDAFRELQTREYIRYDNLPLETKKQEHIQVEFVSNVYMVNNTRVIQCNIRDITDRQRAENAFRKTHEELLALVTEMKKVDIEMQSLNRMNGLLQICTTQDEAYRVVGIMMGELFAGRNGFLASFHASDQNLQEVARWGDEVLAEPVFSMEDCWALRRGQPHNVMGPGADLLCRHFIHPPETGYMCVPLMVQGETLGLLCLMGVAGKKGEHHVREQQLALMVGEAIKLSLSNLKLREKLREQATRDPLTGLFNRRQLEESLPRELHRARRRKSQMCIAMLDLDHFKKFNDTFGHHAGDLLLREFGQVLRGKLRKSDIACRYGGEEFLIVMPDSSLADTCQRVEEIRVLVKKMAIRQGDHLLGTITVSAGIAGTQEHAGVTMHEFLHAADTAMYAAKQAGRDRVVVYQHEEE